MVQNVKLMFWKALTLRKRRWFMLYLEVTSPIYIFALFLYFKTLLPETNRELIYDKTPLKYNDIASQHYIQAANIAYMPYNNVTDVIMSDVSQKLIEKNITVSMVHKGTEEEVISWLRNKFIVEMANTTGSDQDSTSGVGVIFHNTDNVRNLRYTLRSTSGKLFTGEDTIYGEKLNNSGKYYSSGFTTIQALIDQAFLYNFYHINISDNVYIEELVSMKFSAPDLMALMLPFCVMLSFIGFVLSTIEGIVEEKTSGIKEMMRIMGLSPWVVWLNWFIYLWLNVFPVTLLITYFLIVEPDPLVKANFLTVFAFLSLFMISLTVFIFFFSTFFTDGSLALVLCIITWHITTLTINLLISRHPDKFSLWVHILTCFWTPTPLIWIFITINNFQRNDLTWNLAEDLFDDGAGGERMTVGIALIMMCVNTAFYSILTWYFDNVNPGPYGKPKPYLFIFQCFKKKNYYDSKSADSWKLPKSYEQPPQGLEVGIKIENLRKTFNQGKVVAVDNVDLDIYEGNITVLLGHNGAGKTTLMSMLTGFFSPSQGRIIVDGKNIFDNMSDFRRSLGLCPQQNLVFTYFSVLDHLVYFGVLKGLTWDEAEKQGLELLKALNMEEKKGELVAKLSGGMRRKLCLCIAMMGNPKVLILDEPTSGLDPESRRQVWDMLLGLRGQRTILITTHFMEEAEVLGDRIAIMDHGRVSCYGTSMFLKKLYGAFYQLNLTKNEVVPVGPISSIVNQHVSGADVRVVSDSLVTYNIKAEESVCFPELFAGLEHWSKDLGVKGTTISCTTLEDVFLKVIEKQEDLRPIEDKMSNVEIETFENLKKVSGFRLFVQRFMALVRNRLITYARSWMSTLVYIGLAVVVTWYTVDQTMKESYSYEQPDLLISLSSFPRAHVALSSQNSSYTTVLQNIIGDQATCESIPDSTNFTHYMEEQINKSLIQYGREMIAGFSVNSDAFRGAYSVYFIHSPALVLNMVANTLLQLASPSSNITVHNHPLAVRSQLDICELSSLAKSHIFEYFMTASYISLALIIQGMMFITFPLRERVSSSKQLQLMTGVSPTLYWFTTFICDFGLYLVMAVTQVGMFCIFQKHEIYTSSGYMGTLAAVLVLYGMSTITYSYFFTFFIDSSVKASVCFMLINTVLGTTTSVLMSMLEAVGNKFTIYSFILSFNPLYCASYALLNLLKAMYINGTCTLCGKECSLVDPLQYMDAGPDAEHPYGILNFLIFLAVDALLYLTLVLLIERGVFKKLWHWISRQCIFVEFTSFDDDDEDVHKEKQKIIFSTSLREHFNNGAVLCVSELSKKYNRESTAVKSVSFMVNKGECFGLLGVNGAGKSTTFKMLTGEEIPTGGTAALLRHCLLQDKDGFLAQLGYCPQYDALNPLLTAREMLYMYALLRGIPSYDCNGEVSRWIRIIGLEEYADRRCGTYSGGNKRKLSTAMAFIGEPPVVLLDEPTSGVDPVSRRRLWSIMAKCQQAGQAVVITSHSMEECEALCSRLTIMVGGRMRCMGSAPHLKLKFGQGYTVKLKLHTAQVSLPRLTSVTERLKHDIQKCFRCAAIKDEHLGLLNYHIPDPTIPLSRLFMVLEGLKQTHADVIEDYIVSDTTLEEVFMTFARAKAR